MGHKKEKTEKESGKSPYEIIWTLFLLQNGQNGEQQQRERQNGHQKETEEKKTRIIT